VYSLVVRNGTLVDGTGLPPYRADVGVQGGRIAAIGRIRERGAEEIDAEGHVVTPGFVDAHTHLDAQLFWDPLATSSCWHGVTTAVVGNCGFTLAPSKDGERELVLRNLERAEDIPAESMAAGVPWGWERFAEFLDALDAIPKAVNVAAYLGHSALRTWAMGERAFDEPASDDDLKLMASEVVDAMRAGAVGFSTSRSGNHRTSDDRPVASRVATWDEVVALAGELARSGGGIFQLANESAMASADPDARAESMARLRELAVSTGVPTTFGVTTFGDPRRWRELLELIDETAAAGGRMFGQSSGRESGVLYSFQTWLPYDEMPVWRDVRRLPLAEQLGALRDPATRQRLVEAARDGTYSLGGGPQRPVDYDRIFAVEQMVRPNPSIADLAAARGVEPVDVVIDLAVESELAQFFAFVTGNADPSDVATILRHPRTVMTFSDSGAHVSQLINASLPTHLLAYWTREQELFTIERAVQMLTLVPATAWGFSDRGLVREGFVADLNVLDPTRVAPDLPKVAVDFPGGAKRLTQTATGFLATVVGGEVVLRNGEHTGVHPGVLIRRRRRAA
jgi:N-acyl-D-aspartate/D-glutamate deacylase